MSAPKLPSDAGKSAWQANASIFDEKLRHVGEQLLSLDQAHLFAAWPAPGEKDAEKKKFLQQVADIEQAYIGGITTYVQRAKQLLKLAVIGANPFEGFTVAEPKDAVRLETRADFDRYEGEGIKHAPNTAFVIVAGGLGERLGYKGIKLALPSDITTETTYMELYIRWILALQARARVAAGNPTLELQFAIMTSDDTDKLTRELLDSNARFGMSSSQLTVFKQGKVPSLLDNDAHFVLDEHDPFQLDTKPHGHGDVHSLLFKEGIVERWVKGQAGNASSSSSSSAPATVLPVQWIVFFQDTNGLVFHSILASLGVSAERKLHMNSITVPRAQGDAVGAICTLTRNPAIPEDKLGPDDLPNQLTINVEYNQLEGLLGKGVKEPVTPGTNYSVYPGNINVLLMNAPDYLKVLHEKKGVIPEFVNPKYNADKQSFKKPTRLEGMMQDYPKLLPKGTNVGFTQFQRQHAFSAVKNAIQDGVDKQKSGNAAEVAATGEQDMYYWNVVQLQQAGAKLDQPKEQSYRGIKVQTTAHVIFSPSFGVTQKEVAQKIQGNGKIQVSGSSTLVLDGPQITLKQLSLDGTLIILAHPQAKLTVDGLNIKNSGWSFKELTPESEKSVEQKYGIRGYTLDRKEQSYFRFDQPGEFTLNDQNRGTYETKEYKHPARL